MRTQPIGLSIATVAAAACMLLIVGPQRARAQDSESLSIDASVEGGDVAPSERGKFLLGGKIGGIASFNGLDLFLHGGVELGYVFPVLNHGLGAFLQVEYSAPSTEGKVTESFTPERVPGGDYHWKLLQKELVLQPTFLYRMTFLSDAITPYAGLGLRVYLLESITSGNTGTQTIQETSERSTKWGVGVPLGCEFALGPGALTGEALLQWGPLQHTLTGESHLGGVSVFVGYRLLL